MYMPPYVFVSGSRSQIFARSPGRFAKSFVSGPTASWNCSSLMPFNPNVTTCACIASPFLCPARSPGPCRWDDDREAANSYHGGTPSDLAENDLPVVWRHGGVLRAHGRARGDPRRGGSGAPRAAPHRGGRGW